MRLRIIPGWVVLTVYIVMMVLIEGSFTNHKPKQTDTTSKNSSCKDGEPDCSTECNEPGGWHLRGSDWGCCGNYEGCCTYASIICYIHDALCRCCDVDFCGPTCKPEPDCFAPPTTSTCHTGSDCVSTSAEKPCNQNVECSLNAGGDDETLNDGIEGQFEEATKELNDRQNITPSNHTDLYKKFQSDSPQNARNVYGKNISEINTTGGRANSDNLPENGMEGSGETSFRVNEFT